MKEVLHNQKLAGTAKLRHCCHVSLAKLLPMQWPVVMIQYSAMKSV